MKIQRASVASIEYTPFMTGHRHIQNLALIGFMGTGKTSVGHIVASLLHFQFVDTDELIEARAGCPINDIFARQGEAAFRALETQIVDGLAGLKKAVISTGGGLGASQENLDRLKPHALIVCLWASPQTIWERVRSQTHRPLLHDPHPQEKITQLLTEREALYRQADVLVSSEMRSVKDVAHQVLHQFHLAVSQSHSR
jgi:shikimate kinase